MRCETLKRTFRHCPGKEPEEVSSERTFDDGAPPAQWRSHDLGPDGGWLGSRWPRRGEWERPPWGGNDRLPAERADESGLAMRRSYEHARRQMEEMDQMMGSFFSGRGGFGGFFGGFGEPPEAWRHRAFDRPDWRRPETWRHRVDKEVQVDQHEV